MYKHLIVLFFYSVLVFSATSQQDSRSKLLKYDNTTVEIKKISRSNLQEFRDNPKFDYEIIKAKNSWWNDLKNWVYNILIRILEWLFGIQEATGFFSVFFKIVPYILLAILIYILIRFFYKVNFQTIFHSTKNSDIVSLSGEEHIIKNKNIQQLVQNALQNKDYRLAIRYYYLLILQLMGDKEHIVWELQKTNDDYLNELKKQELKQPFSTITRLYDYIWYGGFSIDKAKYLKVEVAFSSLKKTLDKNA